MNEEFNVCGAPVIFSTEKTPPYNPLRRPEISYKKPILFLILFLLGLVLIAASPNYFHIEKWVITVLYFVLYFLLFFKKAVIWFIHLYQNKASDKTRLRCVFEPSCSEYMLLAIDKYGAVIGIFKGIKRLLRCHPPNGGVDYP